MPSPSAVTATMDAAQGGSLIVDLLEAGLSYLNYGYMGAITLFMLVSFWLISSIKRTSADETCDENTSKKIQALSNKFYFTIIIFFLGFCGLFLTAVYKDLHPPDPETSITISLSPKLNPQWPMVFHENHRLVFDENGFCHQLKIKNRHNLVINNENVIMKLKAQLEKQDERFQNQSIQIADEYLSPPQNLRSIRQ